MSDFAIIWVNVRPVGIHRHDCCHNQGASMTPDELVKEHQEIKAKLAAANKQFAELCAPLTNRQERDRVGAARVLARQ